MIKTDGPLARRCRTGFGRGRFPVLLATLRRRASVALLALTGSLVAGLPAQVWPAGFQPELAFATNTPSVSPFVRRAIALDGNNNLVAVRGDLFRCRPRLLPNAMPLLSLHNEDIAFVHRDSLGVVVAGIRTGNAYHLDPNTGQVLATFAVPRNSFDAVSLPSGAVLCSANPLWPAGGATTGVWLASPGQPPRQLLALLGPSGPLALAANGDLVVAELGPIVPPPPGAARLLRIPAASLLTAVAGGTLSMANVVQIGTGFGGIYDLVHDERDRWYVSDPAGGTVVHTAPGGLDAIGTMLDLGPGRYATGLQFVPGSTTPFRAFQPNSGSGALLVSSGDFVTSFTMHRLLPMRPRATIAPGLVVPPGTASLQLAGGPPQGACLWLGSLTVDQPEQIVLWQDGAPLWLGLPPAAAVVLGATALDAQGRGNWALQHPGGLQVRVDLQAVVLAPAAVDLGSTRVLPLLLLP
jgi:hypothetical protein